MGKENEDPGVVPLSDGGSTRHQQGWKTALDLIMPQKKISNIEGGSPAQVETFIFYHKDSPNMSNFLYHLENYIKHTFHLLFFLF